MSYQRRIIMMWNYCIIIVTFLCPRVPSTHYKKVYNDRWSLTMRVHFLHGEIWITVGSSPIRTHSVTGYAATFSKQ